MWLYEWLVALSRRVLTLADRLAPATIAAAITAAAAMSVAAAYGKLFWHDEIYTILVSRLPLPTMWRAALDGIDLAPPLNTVVTRAVHLIAGVGPLATRLPPLAGVLAAQVFIFLTLRRWTNGAMAIAGALLLWFTPARDAAIEARGYGLSLGLFAIAWWAWARAADPGRPARGWALTVMAGALALGTWSHYYSALAFLPLAAGELTRQIARRRRDWKPWIAFTAAAIATLPLGVLARAASAQRATFWARPDAMYFTDTYAFVWRPWNHAVIHDASLAVAIVAVLELIRRLARRQWPRRLPAHLVTAALVTIALPAIGVVLGYELGTFVDRYVLFAAAGFCIALPLLAWWLTPRHGLADAVLVLAVVQAFVVTTRQALSEPQVAETTYQRLPVLATAIRGTEPIVVTGGVRYLELWYRAPAEWRDHLLYLADPAAEREHDGSDTVDRGYLALGRWTPVGVRSFDEYVRDHRRFLMYEMPPTYIAPVLERAQATRRDLARDPEGTLIEVRLPGSQ